MLARELQRTAQRYGYPPLFDRRCGVLAYDPPSSVGLICELSTARADTGELAYRPHPCHIASSNYGHLSYVLNFTHVKPTTTYYIATNLYIPHVLSTTR